MQDRNFARAQLWSNSGLYRFFFFFLTSFYETIATKIKVKIWNDAGIIHKGKNQ